MKPNFALSLSFEGIRLLHRATGGWHVVGDVELSSADLNADLAALRADAVALEPKGLSSKLIIPNDQIRYLTIETGEISLAERQDAATRNLDGATPYPVSDLAYDISSDGPLTHVAAVARETLAEAEAFAAEHQFNPICHVAIPDAGSFKGEPFFGRPESAGETPVERDGYVIVILPGPAVPPAQTPLPDTMPKQADKTEPQVSTETQPKTSDNVERPSPEVITAEPAIKADEIAQAPPPAAPSVSETEKPASPKAAPPSIGFASRRAPDVPAKSAKPSLAGAIRTNDPEIASPSAAAVSAPDLPVDPDTHPVVEVASTSPPQTTPKDESSVEAPSPSVTAGFLSRRKSPKTEAGDTPLVGRKPVSEPSDKSEAQRMTIFGARKPDAGVGGKPRFLGLILTAVLLVFLAGVAAWASVFMDEGLARFFGAPQREQVASLPDTVIPETPQVSPSVTTASLDTGLTSEDAAVLEALRNPVVQPEADLPELTPEQLESRYAVTGIWPKAPDVPNPVALVPLEDLYVTSIDPVSSATDAVALPDPKTFATDLRPNERSAPAAAGTAFALNDRGLVIATPEGALSPDGVLVFAGRPAAVPPKTPVRFSQTPDVNAELSAIAKIRPRNRPGDLAEQNQRANLGGLTRNELAQLRPRLRPVLQKAQEEVKEDEVQTPNPQAVLASARPDGRPRNFARIVARTRKAQETQPTRVAAVAPRTVTPKIPTKTSVAKEATVRNAINLGRVNLIGVYGKPSSRRALVRLANGRYQKVKVGDRIDGGRVSAIGDSELRYKKGNRNLVLKMPKG